MYLYSFQVLPSPLHQPFHHCNWYDKTAATFQCLIWSANHDYNLTTATDSYTLILALLQLLLHVDLNVTATTVHIITQSTNHTASSVVTTTNSLFITDVTTVATNWNLLISALATAITNSANTITTLSCSPTFSTSSTYLPYYLTSAITTTSAPSTTVIFVIITIASCGRHYCSLLQKKEKQTMHWTRGW